MNLWLTNSTSRLLPNKSSCKSSWPGGDLAKFYWWRLWAGILLQWIWKIMRLCLKLTLTWQSNLRMFSKSPNIALTGTLLLSQETHLLIHTYTCYLRRMSRRCPTSTCLTRILKSSTLMSKTARPAAPIDAKNKRTRRALRGISGLWWPTWSKTLLSLSMKTMFIPQ